MCYFNTLSFETIRIETSFKKKNRINVLNYPYKNITPGSYIQPYNLLIKSQ